MAQSILYYPTINIKDSTWLRSAILYWDEVCSIVPYENYTDFSPEILYLQSNGIYRAIYPQDIFSLEDPHAFATSINRYFSTASKKTHTNPDLQKKIYDPNLLTLIHYNKLPMETIDFLLKNKFINIREDGWIEMNDEFAFRYMRLLAEYVIKHDPKDIVLGTDKESNLSKIYPRAHKKQNNTVVSLILNKCLPIPNMDVSYEKILDFKYHRKDELLMLRENLRLLEDNISSCESPKQIKVVITKFKESWEKDLVLSQKLFKDYRIDFALGSLRSFIVDASCAAGLLQWAQSSNFTSITKTGIASLVGASGLVGVGTYYMHYKKHIRDESTQHGFAYIVSRL